MEHNAGMDIGKKEHGPDTLETKAAKRTQHPFGLLYFAFFTLCFGTLTLCSISMFLHNIDQFNFALQDFVWLILASNILLPIIPALILTPFCARSQSFFTLVIFAALGLVAACWLQINFFNANLGLLDGSQPSMEGWAVNIFVWVATIAIMIFAGWRWKRRRWKRIVVGVLAVAICMQSAALVSQLIETSANSLKKQGNYRFSNQEQFILSPEDNIVVLLFDSLSNVDFEAARAEYPEITDWFSDFLYFDNMDSAYFPTYPSVLYTLTGAVPDLSKATDESFDAAWRNERTVEGYRLMKEQGFRCYGIFDSPTNIGGADRALGIMDNVVDDSYKVHNKWMLAKFGKLSLFCALPQLFKPLVSSNAIDFNPAVESLTGESSARYFNYDVYDGLRREGIAISADTPRYIFNHMSGIHYPIETGADCRQTAAPSRNDCTRGCMLLAHEYIQQLKANGIYDNTTLIIMADHGNFVTGLQPVFLIKRANERREALETCSAPVSYKEFFPTILMLAGVESYRDFGETIYDIDEDTPRERSVFVRTTDDNYPLVPRYRGTGTGVRNVFYRYTYTGDGEMLWEKYLSGSPDQIIPMVDTLY